MGYQGNRVFFTAENLFQLNQFLSTNSMTRFIPVCILSFFILIQSCSQRILYGIGDSTMAEYDVGVLSEKQGGENYPLRGWGMYFGDHFKKTLVFENKAVSGRSSKSFRGEGYWDAIFSQLKKGDFVLIQFGHNDQKKDDSLRYTDPRHEFGNSLRQYIQEIRSRGAHPFLATSIARRHFDESGVLIDTHTDYTLTVYRIAHSEKVPLLDLNLGTMALIEQSGMEASKNYYLHIPPGKFQKLPNGLQDNTHLNELGGRTVAEMAVEEIRNSNSKLKRYLKN